MTARKVIPVIVASALAASAGSAIAATEVYTTTAGTYYVTPMDDTYVAPRTTYYYYTPATTEVYTEPPVIVTAPRVPTDDAITQDVVDTLASDPRLSGRIGVETRDQSVELTGIVGTSLQAERAQDDAMRVYGVRDVRNNLAARIGGSRY